MADNFALGPLRTLQRPGGSGPAAPPAHAADTLPLHDAVAALKVADEDRTGYDRDLFRHWTDADRDGCSTRNEVLLDEAVVAPQVTGRCTLNSGRWHSWYDNEDVDAARALDIDHLVPLAEAWDSGASQWTDQRRETYANDLGDERAWSPSPHAPTGKKPTRTPPSGSPTRP